MKDEPTRTELTDAELMALSAIVQTTAILMDAENSQRLANGYSPAWTLEGGDSEEQAIIKAELKRRGVYNYQPNPNPSAT